MTVFEHIVAKGKPKIGKKLPGKTGAVLVTYDGGYQAVLKLAKAHTDDGKTKIYGLSVHSGPRREVAFYKLAKLLGWTDIVPETVKTEVKGMRASAQQFIPALGLEKLDPRLADSDDHDKWVVQFRELMRYFPRDQMLRLTVLDIIAASRDRHGTNMGARLDVTKGKPSYKLVGWDNAASFGLTFARYHNVIHKYVFRYALDLGPYWAKLQSITRDKFVETFAGTLHAMESHHAWLRLQFILSNPHLLPWDVLSEGADFAPEFPAYTSFFNDFCDSGLNTGPLLLLNRSRLSS